jgi:hypothetical protein
VRRLRAVIRATLSARLPCFDVDEHPGDEPLSRDGGITPPPPRREGSRAAQHAIQHAIESGRPAIFWVTPKHEDTPQNNAAPDSSPTLPNTLLLAVSRPHFCSRTARAALERRGVIVGCARNIRCVPSELAAGLLRISICDSSTIVDIKKLLIALLEVISSKECLSRGAPRPSGRLVAAYAPRPANRLPSYVVAARPSRRDLHPLLASAPHSERLPVSRPELRPAPRLAPRSEPLSVPRPVPRPVPRLAPLPVREHEAKKAPNVRKLQARKTSRRRHPHE